MVRGNRLQDGLMMIDTGSTIRNNRGGESKHQRRFSSPLRTMASPIANSDGQRGNNLHSAGRISPTARTRRGSHNDTPNVIETQMHPSEGRNLSSAHHGTSTLSRAAPTMSSSSPFNSPRKVLTSSSPLRSRFTSSSSPSDPPNTTTTSISNNNNLTNPVTLAASRRQESPFHHRYSATSLTSPARQTQNNRSSSVPRGLAAREGPPSPPFELSTDIDDAYPNYYSNSNSNNNDVMALHNNTSTSKKDDIDQFDQHDEHDHTGEAICDYDTDATQLYELLESSQWEDARARCRSHPEETRTWILRKDKSLRVRWKLLPLHAAIIFQSPNFIVATLLEKYPGAASRKDDQGMLPLHLAFRHKQEDEDLLEMLLIKHPKAVLAKDRRDRVPLEHGRDCKYSAKMMRLYADATVAASRATFTTISRQPSTSQPLTHTDATSMVFGLKQRTEAKMESECIERISKLREEHEQYVRTLKKAHDERLQAVREHTAVTVRQVELASEDDKQSLIEHHEEELKQLQDTLQTQIAKDRHVVQVLEEELQQLRGLVENEQARYERSLVNNDRLREYNEDLREYLERISQDQLVLQELLTQQREELDAARNMRKQLVNSMIRQEDIGLDHEHNRGNRMYEVTASIRELIEQVLTRPNPAEDDVGLKFEDEDEEDLEPTAVADQLGAPQGDGRLHNSRIRGSYKRQGPATSTYSNRINKILSNPVTSNQRQSHTTPYRLPDESTNGDDEHEERYNDGQKAMRTAGVARLHKSTSPNRKEHQESRDDYHHHQRGNKDVSHVDDAVGLGGENGGVGLRSGPKVVNRTTQNDEISAITEMSR
jgi:hypothetical protein